jgi:hypothetical protein
MTRDDWRLAVYREMQADLWYFEPELDEHPATSTLELTELSSKRINGNGTFPKVTAAVSGAV